MKNLKNQEILLKEAGKFENKFLNCDYAHKCRNVLFCLDKKFKIQNIGSFTTTCHCVGR